MRKLAPLFSFMLSLALVPAAPYRLTMNEVCEMATMQAEGKASSCHNDGKKREGSDEPRCKCWNPCPDEVGPLDDYQKVHGDPHCATYCKKPTCECKPPCA